MSVMGGAIKRAKQRSKLPRGDHIIPAACEGCQTSILCWNDDFFLARDYPFKRLCSYCKQAEQAYNRAIFGKEKKKP